MIAVFSDVHGDIERLKEMHKQEAGRKFYCLGDVLEYGADSKEDRCIDLLLEMNALSVQGNHEQMFLALQNDIQRGGTSHRPLRVTNDNLKNLKSYSLAIDSENMRFSHSIPLQRFARIRTLEDLRYIGAENLLTSPCIWFIGHSHQPACFVYNKGIFTEQEGDFAIRDDLAYLINPGALGKDGDYIVYNQETGKVERKKI